MLIHCQVNVQDAVMDMDIDLTELNCEASQVNFFYLAQLKKYINTISP